MEPLYRRTGSGRGTRYHPAAVSFGSDYLTEGVWLVRFDDLGRSITRIAGPEDLEDYMLTRAALGMHEGAAAEAVVRLQERAQSGAREGIRIIPAPADVARAVLDAVAREGAHGRLAGERPQGGFPGPPG